MALAKVDKSVLSDPPTPTYTLFVRMEEVEFKGGLVYFSVEDFDASKEAAVEEVKHILEQNEGHSLVSWGITNSATGEVVQEYSEL